MANSVVLENIAELNKLRIKILWRMLLVLVLTSGVVYLTNLAGLPLLVALFIGLVVGLLLYVFLASLTVGEYVPLFKNKVVKSCVAEYSSGLNYDLVNKPNSIEFQFSGLHTAVLQKFGCDHHIQARKDGVTVNCTLMHVNVEPSSMSSSSGGVTDRVQRLFKGYYLISGERNNKLPIENVIARCIVVPSGSLHPEKLKLKVTSDQEKASSVYEKTTGRYTMIQEYEDGPYPFYPAAWSYETNWKAEDKLATGNEEFDKRYDVYVEKPEYLEKFLTAEVQESILNMRRTIRKDMSFSFAYERCYVCIQKDIFPFRPDYLHSVGRNTEMRLIKEISKVDEIISAVAGLHSMVFR
jgi:hypothetical protein